MSASQDSVKRSRSRRPSEQWRRLVTEQRQSGMSQTAFCSERSLAYATFCKWRRKLDHDEVVSGSVDEPAFIELTPPNSPAGDVAHVWDVELELVDGTTLRLRHR